MPHATPVLRRAALAAALVAVACLGPASAGSAARDAPLVTRTEPADDTGRYVAPTGGAVLRLFDPPAQRWGRGHRGVDLEAPDGEVRAPGAGVVTFAGTVVDRGVLTVTHADGLRSSLEPVDALVPVGTQVRAGDVIAQLGASSHCRGAPCVHWGVRRGEEYLDPLDLIGTVTVVLLP